MLGTRLGAGDTVASKGHNTYSDRQVRYLESVMEEIKQDIVRGTWGSEMRYLDGVAGKGDAINRHILLNPRPTLHLSPCCPLTWQTTWNVLLPGPANAESLPVFAFLKFLLKHN